jgi:hypothetical protein
MARNVIQCKTQLSIVGSTSTPAGRLVAAPSGTINCFWATNDRRGGPALKISEPRHPQNLNGVGEVVAITADTIEVRFAPGVAKLNAGMRRHHLQGAREPKGVAADKMRYWQAPSVTCRPARVGRHRTVLIDHEVGRAR